mmetsp:Transcript_89535/g.109576  ORF Transcript_89535/g.109576 Transcript_89535/m.109576 type:complete len:89 (-) Transcript_89535:156-422(-)
MPCFPDQICYSEKYFDDEFEYRHAILPKELAARVVQLSFSGSRLLEEHEWRSLGVQGGAGWMHYEFHKPEMHVLLMRRPLPGIQPAQQ